MHCLIHLQADIIPRIMSDFPPTAVPDSILYKFSFLTLADPDFSMPLLTDVLLGIESIWDVIPDLVTIVRSQPLLCALSLITFSHMVLPSSLTLDY